MSQPHPVPEFVNRLLQAAQARDAAAADVILDAAHDYSAIDNPILLLNSLYQNGLTAQAARLADDEGICRNIATSKSFALIRDVCPHISLETAQNWGARFADTQKNIFAKFLGETILQDGKADWIAPLSKNGRITVDEAFLLKAIRSAHASTLVAATVAVMPNLLKEIVTPRNAWDMQVFTFFHGYSPIEAALLLVNIKPDLKDADTLKNEIIPRALANGDMPFPEAIELRPIHADVLNLALDAMWEGAVHRDALARHATRVTVTQSARMRKTPRP